MSFHNHLSTVQCSLHDSHTFIHLISQAQISSHPVVLLVMSRESEVTDEENIAGSVWAGMGSGGECPGQAADERLVTGAQTQNSVY